MRYEIYYSLPPVIEKTRSYQPVFRVVVAGETVTEACAEVDRLHPGSTIGTIVRLDDKLPLPYTLAGSAAEADAPLPAEPVPAKRHGPTPEARPICRRCRMNAADESGLCWHCEIQIDEVGRPQ